MSLRPIHIELTDANALVAAFHRHHKPVVGHRFSIGLVHGRNLVGAAIVGRPVSRELDYRKLLEVTRLVTDGTPHACSALYAAAARAGRELGYEHIQTYILAEEPGTTLIAAGWEFECITIGGDWNHGPFTGRRTDQPMGPKQRWGKKLREPVEELVVPSAFQVAA